MMSSSLSDSSVIDSINDNFVPVHLNLTENRFPEDLPGLKVWHRAYEANWKYRSGFATSVVLDPSGFSPLGTSGCGHWWEVGRSLNFNPEKFSGYLQNALDRSQRFAALAALEGTVDAEALKASKSAFSQEVLESVRAVNSCERPGKRQRHTH